MKVPAFAESGVHAVTRFAHKQCAVISKHSPTILTGLGIAGMIGATVLASAATLHVGDILDEAKADFDKINQGIAIIEAGQVDASKYTKKDVANDRFLVYSRTARKLIALYGPAFLLGVTSIACLVQSHRILKSRNVALAAAYTGLDKAYQAYRARVREEFGEERDLEYSLGARHEEHTYTDAETGQEVTEEVLTIDPNEHSPYAKFFDEYNVNWTKSPENNLFFLQNQQNYANDMLRQRGHLFLNEVYDMLDIPRTKQGAVVGWTRKGGNSDGYVDFGIFDVSDAKKRDFVNGYERSILLDFNVDGVIYDLI